MELMSQNWKGHRKTGSCVAKIESALLHIKQKRGCKSEIDVAK